MNENDLLTRQFYMVREKKTRYYMHESGGGATPKLYFSQGTAQRVANGFNKKRGKSVYSYEAVPVMIVIGSDDGNIVKDK